MKAGRNGTRSEEEEEEVLVKLEGLVIVSI